MRTAFEAVIAEPESQLADGADAREMQSPRGWRHADIFWACVRTPGFFSSRSDTARTMSNVS